MNQQKKNTPIRWRLVVSVALFFGILFLGLAMRSPELLAGNYLFGFDQGHNYMEAYKIGVLKKMTLIGAEVGMGGGGISGLFHGPGFYYLLALINIPFKGDPYGGIVLMWIGGVTALILSFLLTRKIFGNAVALVAMYLVSVAPLIAPQSRFVWGPHLASIPMVFYYYFLYKIQEKPLLYAPVAAFTAGIIYHFDLVHAVPLVLLTLIVVPLVYRIRNWKVYVAMFIALILAFFPLIAFEARHGFMATRGLLSHITTEKKVETQTDLVVSASQSAVAASQGPFFLKQKSIALYSGFRDTFVFEYGRIRPEGYALALSAVAIIIAISIRRTKNLRIRRYLIALTCLVPVTFAMLLPLRGSVWSHFFIHMYFAYIGLFAYACVFVWRRMFHSWLYAVATMFTIFFLLSTWHGVVPRLVLNWHVDYFDYGGKEKIAGKRAIIDYIYRDAAGRPFSVFVFTPPVYTYPYEYLFLTYAKDKYGFVPTQEKKGTAYMIIEMDGTKPHSYKGWLETVIIDGTPVWERYLTPSEHILQKRVF